jgi:hypothetical protein
MKRTNHRQDAPLKQGVVFIILLLTCSICRGEVISSARMTQWQSNVGVQGDIPNVTTIYKTLASGSTLSQINAAIAACPANQVVKLAAGTYNLSGQIYFGGKSNVVLRGAGPSSTVLVFTGSPYMANIYAETPNMPWIPGTAPPHIANWTAGYAKGSDKITLSSVSGLSVGSYLWVDQVNDGNDVGSNHSYEGCNNCGRQNGTRSQQQMCKVTAISGTGGLKTFVLRMNIKGIPTR